MKFYFKFLSGQGSKSVIFLCKLDGLCDRENCPPAPFKSLFAISWLELADRMAAMEIFRRKILNTIAIHQIFNISCNR